MFKHLLATLFAGIILSTQVQSQLSRIEQPDYCAEAARCRLLQADLERASFKKLVKKFFYYRDEAVKLINRHRMYTKCRLAVINKKCKSTLLRCSDDFKDIAVWRGIPENLVRQCSMRSFAYTLFLCKTVETWPINITSLAPSWFNECRYSCNIRAYDVYHRENGVNTFPVDWNQQLDHQLALDSTHQTLTNYELRGMSDDKTDKPLLWSKDQYVEKTLRGIPFSADQIELPNVCPQNTYVYAARVNKYGFQGHCRGFLESNLWGPSIQTKYYKDKKDLQGLDFIIEYDLKCEAFGAYINEESFPKSGSFLLGVEVRFQNPYARHFIVYAQKLCSGHYWSDTNALKPESFTVSCPPLTAICSVNGEHSKEGYLTNLSFGCCIMEDIAWYSSIPAKHISGFTDGRSTDPQEATKYYITEGWRNHDVFSGGKMCPIGQFVNRFQWKIIFPNLSGGSEDWDRTSKWLLIMQIDFYCNGFGAQSSELGYHLTNETYGTHFPKPKNPYKDEFIGDFYCDGFFTGATMGVEDVANDAYNAYFTYGMKCSNPKEANISHTFNTYEKDFVTGGIDYHHIYYSADFATNSFTCPDGFAICGIKYHTRTKHLTVHGVWYSFICCPIPHVFPLRDCGSPYVTIDLVSPKPSCQFQEGQKPITCETTATYSRKWKGSALESTNPESTDSWQKYGFNLRAKYQAIIEYPKRQVGKTMNETLTGVAKLKFVDRRIVLRKREIRARRIKRVEPVLTTGMVILSLVVAAIGAGSSMASAAIGKSSPDITTFTTHQKIKFEHTIEQKETQEVKRQYTVHKTQNAFFYDAVLRCGEHTILADDPIRYITDRFDADVEVFIEYIGRSNDQLNLQGAEEFTVEIRTEIGDNYGYGLYIPDRINLAKLIKWELVTKGMQAKFMNAFRKYNISKDIVLLDVWQPYDSSVQVKANLVVKKDEFLCVYRIIASCSDIKVFTSVIAYYSHAERNYECYNQSNLHLVDTFDVETLIPNRDLKQH